MDILLLLTGLALILAGANFLTDGSAALAQRFRVPEFIIGLTIVAVGTSTPELVVSVLSAIAGKSDVAIGNVVGSNIFNVFLILGICALIRPLPLTAGNIRRDIPFGVITSILLLLLASDSWFRAGAADRIGRIDGIVMLALYILLMIYTGMMPGELFAFKKDMIDWDTNEIRGCGLKTKKRKETPIVFPQLIAPVLLDLCQHSDSRIGNVLCMSRDRFYGAFHAALARCGARDLKPYSCRHTTATALALGNIAPSVIQEVMRHTKFSTTQRYIHPDMAAAHAAVDTLLAQGGEK